MTEYVVELGNSSKFEPDFLFHEGGGRIAWSRSTRKDSADKRPIDERIKEAQEYATKYKTKKQAEKEVKELFGSVFKYRISEAL